MEPSKSNVKRAALLKEARSLSENGLHESAILLASLLVSLFEEGFPRACARTVYAHVLRADSQYKRALQAYQDALHELNRLRGSLPTEAASMVSDDGDVAMNDDEEKGGDVDEENAFWTMAAASGMEENDHRHHDPAFGNDEVVVQQNGSALLSEKKRRRKSNPPQSPVASLARFSGNIKFKMACCHLSLCQEEAAVSVLEGIPREDISGAALALLGKLKRRLGVKGGVELLKESVRKEPFALEVILTLLEMDVDVEEVINLITLQGKRSIATWMEDLIRAHAAAFGNRQRDAIQRFSRLSVSVFPSNAHVLNSLARLEVDGGNREGALSYFSRARAIDPLALDGADLYAGLLRSMSDRTKLVQLTHELLNSGGDSRPEPWVAAAHLSDMRGDKDKALSYVNRAAELNPLHVPALHMKGLLLLGSKRPMESISSYTRALTVRRDLAGLKGLVDAYLSMQPPRVGDAIIVAQEAIQLMPRDPRASILMGKALAGKASSEKLAGDFFMRAIKLDSTGPNFVASALLADVRLSQFQRGDVGRETLVEVASLLARCIHARGVSSVMTPDHLYCKIGTLYAYAGDRCRALENFHDALSVNALSKEARDALEALERVDPPLSEQRPRRASSARHQQISPARRSPPARASTGSSGTPVSIESRLTGASALSPQRRAPLPGITGMARRSTTASGHGS